MLILMCSKATYEMNIFVQRRVLSFSVDIFLRRKVQLLQSVSLDFEIISNDCWTTKDVRVDSLVINQ